MRTNQMPRLALALLAGALLGSTACSRLHVESDPPGARVLWSPDGLEPWRSWPPNSWEFDNRSNGNATPLLATGVYGDTVYVTVEKDGYRQPLPQLVQLYPWSKDLVWFDLTELPETYAARMREDGFVRYEGSWVKPADAGLEEYGGEWMPADRAFRLRQQAAGLVEYLGEWLDPEVAAERERIDREAEGLISFKDRWVTPEQRTREEAIDARVAAIAEDKAYPDLPSPRVIGRADADEAQIQLYNSTGQRVQFLFSGPESRSFTLDPYSAMGVRSEERILLLPGRYGIAIVPEELDAAGRRLTEELRGQQLPGSVLGLEPAYGSWPLAPQMEVGFNYTGRQGDLNERLDQLEIPEPELDFEPPEIEIPEMQLPEEPERPRGPRPGGFPGAGGGRRPQ